jgi:AraC-like DNA-binding protein
MVRGIRQYGRWLRDNYADMEHEEVWQSFVVLGIMLLVYVIYSLDVGELVYEYVMEFILVVVICYLLWRVETLSDLRLPVNDAEEETGATEDVEDNDLPPSIRNNIELLLQQHCIDEQLYLQHDLNLLQLAKAIGTNRSYLSRYFASQGTTYNAYINDLRVNHFVCLYHESVASKRSFTTQQLAMKSGFRSYNTFGATFKKTMGMNTTEWMRLTK